MYLITHLVKPGTGKPSEYTLQPWRNKQVSLEEIEPEKLKGAIYATAIAKYVVKKGRLTIPPEQVFTHADMVPPKPEGWMYKGEPLTNGHVDGEAIEVLPRTVTGDEWNWDVIEAERLRGLRVAQKFAEMDALHEYFDGGKDGVLGEFTDLLF